MEVNEGGACERRWQTVAQALVNKSVGSKQSSLNILSLFVYLCTGGQTKQRETMASAPLSKTPRTQSDKQHEHTHTQNQPPNATPSTVRPPVLQVLLVFRY